MSTAHGVILGLGVLIILLGLYLLATLEFPAAPALGTLVVGLALVVLGLAETFVETEFNSSRRK